MPSQEPPTQEVLITPLRLAPDSPAEPPSCLLGTGNYDVERDHGCPAGAGPGCRWWDRRRCGPYARLAC